jgi:signal transduction histidine kinase
MREWFRPPRQLLVILLLLTAASVSALLWSGWKLTEQESAVDAQRSRERLDQAADRVAALLRANLAETGERLAAVAASPSPSGLTSQPDASLLLVMTRSGVTAYPPARLLYAPLAAAGPEAPAWAFGEGEAAEVRERQMEEAAGIYQRLTTSADRAVRAGALMRLARVQRHLRRTDAASASYQRLSRLEGVRVAGTPADLVARHALCDLSRDAACGTQLQQDLLAGRWSVTRGQFEFYRAEAIRMAGHEEALGDAPAYTEAASAVWSEWSRTPDARGQRTVWVGNEPWLTIWRGAPDRQAVLIQRPEAILRALPAEPGAAFALLDEQGRVITGGKPPGDAVVRLAADSQLPWSLAVTRTGASPDDASAARKRLLLLILGMVVVFLVAGTYLIARAIRREAAVARLQSEFVATVSHEFRSPLTAMRQLSEILAQGRVPSQERRQTYYDTLVSETRRLQRLVETVLNLGRMEEGRRQYRFEEIDAGDVIEGVVSEFEMDLAASGRRIDVTRPDGGCPVQADPEALGLAVRNLVDNALKYSPGEPAVFVSWRREDGSVAIRVRDCGIGIPTAEQRVIFQKFVRGRAAVDAHVKGTGVGLATVSHVVRAHGGDIRVDSAPGEGSTFTIRIPARQRSRGVAAAAV